MQTTTEASDEILIREQQDPRDCENLQALARLWFTKEIKCSIC